jgi:predicted DNA-binding transcriptional regulator AlpA
MRHQSARPAPSTATYLHAGQVTDLLGGSPNTIARRSRQGRLPHQRTLGGHRRSPHPAIRALAARLAKEVSR